MSIEIINGTAEENFALALQEEQFAIACGPTDPYYRIAKSNVEYYLYCAARIERGLHGGHSKSSFHGVSR